MVMHCVSPMFHVPINFSLSSQEYSFKLDNTDVKKTDEQIMYQLLDSLGNKLKDKLGYRRFSINRYNETGYYLNSGKTEILWVANQRVKNEMQLKFSSQYKRSLVEKLKPDHWDKFSPIFESAVDEIKNKNIGIFDQLKIYLINKKKEN